VLRARSTITGTATLQRTTPPARVRARTGAKNQGPQGAGGGTIFAPLVLTQFITAFTKASKRLPGHLYISITNVKAQSTADQRSVMTVEPVLVVMSSPTHRELASSATGMPSLSKACP